MNGKAFLWRSRQALLVALAVTVTLAPLPVLAEEPSPPAKAPGLLASVAKLGVTERLAAPRPPAARSAQVSKEDLSSASFFKKPLGVVILATLAVGAGYAIYSTQNDRVHSAGKQ